MIWGRKWAVYFATALTLIGSNLNAQALRWQSFEYKNYPWLDSSMNVFQAHDKAVLRPLFLKLNHSNKKRVNILHIGDSHVQADIFTNETRMLLGNTFGYAGRGIVFPYTTAKTHTAADYQCFHTGKWLYAKNVEKSPELNLGVSGVTSKTYDVRSQFKLQFREGSIQKDFTRLKILCKRSPESFDIKITTPGETQLVSVYETEKDTASDEIIVNLNAGYPWYRFEFVQSDSSQQEFEIYGISIESPKNSGVLYTSVGINGAGHYSIMREDKLPQHLGILKPDAIILDVGANDFYNKGMDKEKFRENLVSIINLFKEFAPNAVIILSNSQDIHRGGYSLAACSIFSYMIADVAASERVAFYDWYRVAGGNRSMKIWKSLSLANKDGVHLTRNGYELKGTLIYQAFRNTHKILIEKPDTARGIIIPCFDTLILGDAGTVTTTTIPVQLNPLNPGTEINKSDSTYNPDDNSPGQPVDGIEYQKVWKTHTVRRGETAWSIAQRYNVSVLDLKKWNRLPSYSLKAGRKLKILVVIKKENIKPVAPKNNGAPKKNNTNRSKAVYHSVRSGETLYSISRRYGTSVADIKKLNGLRKDNLRIGQRLRIK